MPGLLSTLVQLVGFAPPQATAKRRRAPVARTRPAPAPAARNPVPARAPASEARRMEENFGGAPAAPARTDAPRRPVPRTNERPSLRRTRRVGGGGMLFLAVACMGGGAWAGSQVQAFAVGEVRQAGGADPAQVISTGKGPAFTF